MLPNKRRACLVTSPFQVLYVMCLLIAQYIFNMNLKELPEFAGEMKISDIGLGRFKNPPEDLAIQVFLNFVSNIFDYLYTSYLYFICICVWRGGGREGGTWRVLTKVKIVYFWMYVLRKYTEKLNLINSAFSYMLFVCVLWLYSQMISGYLLYFKISAFKNMVLFLVSIMFWSKW